MTTSSTPPESPPTPAKADHIPFTIEETRSILSLSRAMGIAGGLVLLAGVVTPLPSLGRLIWASEHPLSALGVALLGLVALGLQALLGVWLIQGAMLFRHIADHQHNDQVLLVYALGRVRRALWLKSVLLVALGLAFGLGGTAAIGAFLER